MWSNQQRSQPRKSAADTFQKPIFLLFLLSVGVVGVTRGLSIFLPDDLGMVIPAPTLWVNFDYLNHHTNSISLANNWLRSEMREVCMMASRAGFLNPETEK